MDEQYKDPSLDVFRLGGKLFHGASRVSQYSEIVPICNSRQNESRQAKPSKKSNCILNVSVVKVLIANPFKLLGQLTVHMFTLQYSRTRNTMFSSSMEQFSIYCHLHIFATHGVSFSCQLYFGFYKCDLQVKRATF